MEDEVSSKQKKKNKASLVWLRSRSAKSSFFRLLSKSSHYTFLWITGTLLLLPFENPGPKRIDRKMRGGQTGTGKKKKLKKEDGACHTGN